MPEKTENSARLGETDYWVQYGIFMKHRGNFGKFVSLFSEMAFENDSPYFCDSPSQLRAKNFFAGDALALGTKIFQLIRDGKLEFAEEVLRALKIPKYLLPGEEPIGQKTTPITLFILDPEKTIFLFRAISPYGFFDEMSVFNNPESISYKWVERIRPQMWKIFEMLPSLKKYIHFYTNRGTRELDPWNSPGCIQSAYLENIVLSFWPWLGELNIMKHFIAKSQNTSFDNHKFDKDDLVYSFEEIDYHFRPNHLASSFLYAVEGSRSEVLANFPRPIQERIASWQLNVSDDLGYKYIGLHDSAEHSQWTKKWPSFASSGTSHGLGAIYIPSRYYELPKKYKEIDRKTPGAPFRLLFEVEKDRS